LPYIRLGLRLGNDQAKKAALRTLSDETSPEAVRVGLIEVVGQTENADCAPFCLALLDKPKSEKVRESALIALRHFPQNQVAEGLLEKYPKLSNRLQGLALDALASRLAWARMLVAAVEAGRVDAKDLKLDQLRRMTALQDANLNELIEKRWGRIHADSPEEKRNTINRLKLVLSPSGTVGRDAKGNLTEGKKVFQATCAVCHKMFGEGNSVGPDLTTADRKNTDYLLSQTVDPSAYIRPEYVNYEVEMNDDSVVNGLMVESTTSTVTLVDRNNTRQQFARAQIRELKESSVSLMPEGLLEALTPNQVMDLFAYLQATDVNAASNAAPQNSARPLIK
jgi:putative heme-binding domain-containing protein